jgi:tetratricopeptide (TPR) repeat protein
MKPPPSRSLELAEAEWEALNFQAVLHHTSAVLAHAPELTRALELRARALMEVGRLEAADDAFADLLALEPENPTFRLAAAEALICRPGDDRVRIAQGLALLDRDPLSLRAEPALQCEVHFLRGLAASALGELQLALDEFDAALVLEPDYGEARLERAQTLFELARFEEAHGAFHALTRDFPENPWAWHGMGLVAEQRGGDADGYLTQARRLAPDEFPPPQRLDGPSFDRAVQDAIQKLPGHAVPHLANVVISVEPIPGPSDLLEGVSPATLGLFRGRPVDERSPTEATDHETAHIVLFQKNLERFARSRTELLEEIRVTILHEVGHLLGLDEDELYDRGLD